MDPQDATDAEESPRLRWHDRHRWVAVVLMVLLGGLAPSPPQIAPRPPDEYRQEDDDPLDTLPSLDVLAPLKDQANN